MSDSPGEELTTGVTPELGPGTKEMLMLGDVVVVALADGEAPKDRLALGDGVTDMLGDEENDMLGSRTSGLTGLNVNGRMSSVNIGDTLDPTLGIGPRSKVAEGMGEADTVTSIDTDGTGVKISSVSDGV